MNRAMVLYAHLTDKELADKVKAGQKNCYEVLIRRHSQALYRVARMYSFSHTEAEELISCSFLAAYKNLNEYQNPLSFRLWLTKLMINHCIKSKKEVAGLEKEILEPACTARAVHHSDRLSATGTSIGKAEACLEQLPAALRAVYILTEIDGYSVSETAYLLDTSEEHIKNRINKAMVSLRKLARRWFQFTDIYQFDNLSCERVVYRIMKNINEKVGVPVGAP